MGSGRDSADKRADLVRQRRAMAGMGRRASPAGSKINQYQVEGGALDAARVFHTSASDPPLVELKSPGAG